MPFPQSVKDDAYRRSGGRCECRRASHSHISRCSTTLTPRSAEYHHITAQSADGHDGLSNCEVLCVQCHRGTASYGRS